MHKKVILLANLGSPNSPEVKDVKPYLDEFLMDEKVIDVPYWIRYLLVKGIIVPFRSPKSAKAYQSIWTKEGSPLIVITKNLAEKVQELSGIPTYYCMRYANPTPSSVLDTIIQENSDVKEVILVPMYPHYAMSSYETAVDHVKSSHQKGNYPFTLKIIPPYYNDTQYIDSLAESISPYLSNDYDHILFSYHGIPERHLTKTQPQITKTHCLKCENCCQTPHEAHQFCYRHQVIETTKMVTKSLGLDDQKVSWSFQSRLGQDKWLKPYTAQQFENFPKQGIKKLLVVCPAFVSDCLETLEEIQEEGKEEFLHAGGEVFDVVPCLNTNQLWVETIIDFVQKA
jgi:protoporphyrin/coproporphyrin ferrochelatase